MNSARLDLDFLGAPRAPAWPGVLLLAASLALAAGLWLRFNEVQLELRQLETARSLVAAERGRSRPLAKARAEDEAKSADAAQRQLALPWAWLLESVEGAATRDVALLQLQPDAQQRVLRLTAEARHRGAMFEYLRRLGAAPAFAEVHLVSHQVRLDEPQRPIQFAVQASIRPAQ